MGCKVDFLKTAGTLSFFVAILHIGIIFGGADWYRFFGAGEKIASLVEQGSIEPTIRTFILTIISISWALYAWSGAGLLPRYPFLRSYLFLITFVYFARGLVGLVIPFVSNHPRIVELSINFWIWSSIICLCFGIMYLKGIIDRWSVLSK